MKFSKSINGYSPDEVNQYEKDLIEKFEAEKNDLYHTIEISKKELEELENQKKALTNNLHSVKESSMFFTSYDKHFSKTLHDAEMEALEKIESIIIDEENFVEKINEEILKIDDHLLILKKDLNDIYNDIETLAQKIIIREDIDHHINNLDKLIKEYDLNDASTTSYEEIKTKQAIVPKLTLAKPKEEASIAIRPSTEQKRPKTVLIAERNKDTSALLNTILEREGYKTTLVADAYAVMNMTKEYDPYGVIILDSLIPYIEINGLIKQIRNSKWCDVPILILSSENKTSNSVILLNNGANDYIEKPFNPRELIARVNRIHSTPPGACMIKGG